MGNKLRALFILSRPKQWLKQGLVFLPIIAEGRDASLNLVLKGFVAALIFTFAAVGVYYLNDYRDFEKDRLDAAKKNRPLAAGLVTKREALIGVLFFLLASVSSSLYFYNTSKAYLVLVSYIAINIIYSVFDMKQLGNIGAFMVASGFSLRWIFGSLIIGVEISWWATIIITQLALFMLAGKRFQSNRRKKDQKKESMEEDHDYWLLSLVIYAAFFIATYSAFIAQSQVQKTWGESALLASTLPLALGLSRYLEIVTHSSKYLKKDSTESMITDAILIALAILFIIIMFTGRLLSES